MTTAEEALRLAEGYVFGTDPGRLPALLHDALEHTEAPGVRARLGATLARLWSFAGEPARAVPFADAARHEAEQCGDPVVLADALDACLAAHWGVDEIDLRRDLARELDEVTAHLLDPEARLRAHVWLLTCASERLDVTAMNRQMRALEVLAETSARAMVFAASRRLMLDLMRGRLDTLPTLVALEERALAESPDPDGFMVLGSMQGYGGVITGDLELAAAMAPVAEQYAESEGVVELYAESAWIWCGAGQVEHALELVAKYDAATLDSLPRNFNYLLILQLALDVALAAGAVDLVREITPRLMPYAGRAVINAGAVMFHGVTDDTLARACAMLGDAESAERLRESALATYRRIGASWWRERLEAGLPATVAPVQRWHLRRGPAGVWLVGSAAAPIPARRGLDHLHTLVTAAGRPVAAAELAEVAVEQPDVGPVADEVALASYRRRLRELEDELAEADRTGDAEQGARAQAERDALLSQVGAATGLGGRLRRSGGSAERARVAVRKAITSAIAAIAEVDADMAAHLSAQVETGFECRYRPDGIVAWDLETHGTRT